MEPKPCPFCGSDQVAHGQFGRHMIVACLMCFCQGPSDNQTEVPEIMGDDGFRPMRERATKLWNTRADDE